MASGEDQDGPSLRDYVDRLFADHLVAHREHQQAHDREHHAAQSAIDTAALLAKENKADANEWRATMSDRERTFATREWAEARSQDVDRRIQALERTIAQLQGALNVARFVGFGGFLTALGALVWAVAQPATGR